MALFTANATVTPSQLVATLGPVSMAQAPASKHAWALKKIGFDIQANKDGREVVSYTMLSAPATAPVAKAVKSSTAAPKASNKPTKAVKAPKPTAAPVAAAKPTKRRSPTVKYGPADKTGRSEISGVTETNELENMSELDTEAEDLGAVIASLRA
jgi:hypothetical protein